MAPCQASDAAVQPAIDQAETPLDLRQSARRYWSWAPGTPSLPQPSNGKDSLRRTEAAAAITLTVAAASWRTLRRALHLLPAAALRDEPSSPRR